MRSLGRKMTWNSRQRIVRVKETSAMDRQQGKFCGLQHGISILWHWLVRSSVSHMAACAAYPEQRSAREIASLVVSHTLRFPVVFMTADRRVI